VIELARVTGLATVQDGGRPGHMHEGVPHGGALVPELLARANAAAQNGPGEAAIEAFGPIALVAKIPVVLGLDDGEDRALAPGERIDLGPPVGARVRYVAVRGAFDVPRVLGSRSTLLLAGIGGHEGRALKKGDVLRVGDAVPEDPVLPEGDDAGAIRVVPGPDLAWFAPGALERLFGSSFTISPASDRTGTRLEGPPIPRVGGDEHPSAPMIRGAIEVTVEGRAIVLGPDHPTTGGYPVIACVIARDFGRIMRIPVGGLVRFTAEAAR
jgi:biotin-dependent carboxylase-like uncharacterized protein